MSWFNFLMVWSIGVKEKHCLTKAILAESALLKIEQCVGKCAALMRLYYLTRKHSSLKIDANITF